MEEWLGERLATPDNHLLVAILDGQGVGFALVQIRAQPETPLHHPRTMAHIDSFAVDERFHRMGIGTALMDAVLALAVAHGTAAVTLDVRAFNQAALAFYEAYGLTPYGYRLAIDPVR